MDNNKPGAQGPEKPLCSQAAEGWWNSFLHARGAILPIMWQISLEGHPQPDPTCDGCRPKYIGGNTALQPRPSTRHMASSSRITSCLACSTSTPLLLALMLLVMFKVHMCNLNPFGSSALNSTSTTVVVLWCSTLLMHLWCSSFFWNV